MTFKVIFWNMRGGSGKSTLALGLARALIERQKTVGIVDLNSQMQNAFFEVQVLSKIDEQLDFNIIDSPPALYPEIEKLLIESNMVVIPHQCCTKVDSDKIFLKYCDPRKTFLVPTWFINGFDSFKVKNYQVTDQKLRWQIPLNQEDVKQISKELADSILGSV